ncbi:hypothetical protein [Kitasatospora sp. NPDC094015]|uniref:hypothetical protein n=1 Tax=Kitasatospora sp. NPDC094015 TaxID=3155205 RepID=UPI00333432BB
MNDDSRPAQPQVLPPVFAEMLSHRVGQEFMASPRMEVALAAHAAVVTGRALQHQVAVLAAGAEWYRDWLDQFAEQVTAVAEFLLPDNIRALDGEDWAALLDISRLDGICLVWAPRASIVRELLDAEGTEARDGVVAEHRQEILADVAASLKLIEHPELVQRARLGLRAVQAAEAGHWEASIALATTVIDAAVTKGLRPALHQEFKPFITSKGSPGTHTVLSSSFAQVPPVRRAHTYVRWLVLAGLQLLFHWGSGTDRYNRHAVSHGDSNGYSESFVVPALLILQALLRDLETQLPYPVDDERH